VVEIDNIPDIIASIIEVKKKAKLKSVLPNDTTVREYFRGYLDFIGWKEAISNHTVKGKKPIKLISVKAPNQSDQELAYVIDNYKQITLPVSFEFLSTIGRGLHDANWSVEFAEDKPDYVNSEMTLKKYLDEGMVATPLRMSYDSWFKFVLPSVKINDSMGVIAFKPYREERTTENEEGETVIAGDTLPEPIPYYYGCERVLSDLDSGYALIETNRYSKVMKGGRDVYEGMVFELYDDSAIYIIEQTGTYNEYKFEIELYFKHDLGYIPVTYLQGIPIYYEDGSIAYQSPFLMVSDILDEVLLDGCNLRSAKATSVYPQKVMIGNDCQFQDDNFNKCKNGFVLAKDGASFYKCPECHGTGMGARTSPNNTIYVRGKSSLDDGDGMKPVDALTYVSPSIDTPKFLREEIQQGLMNALSILHLKTTNTVAQPTATDTTATGMVMDEKGKYAFIKSVVDQLFEIYEFGLKTIGKMRYRDDYVAPVVQRPITYDFNTEGDYLIQISAAQAAGAPPVVIASYVYKYLKAIFYDNPKTARAYDVIIAADRLFTMTKEQIQSELPRNLIQPWEVVLHDSALTFIANLQRINPDFLNQDMQVMIDQLVAEAQANTPGAVAVRPTLESILGNANA